MRIQKNGFEVKNELHAPRTLEKLEVKTKHVKPKTPVIVVLLIYVGILLTETSIKAYPICIEEIIRYETRGIHVSPEEPRLALFLCGVK